MRFLPIPDKETATSTLGALGFLILCIIAGLIFRLGTRLQKLSHWINERVNTLITKSGRIRR